jgi:phytanoyl-CoA hydroxylase
MPALDAPQLHAFAADGYLVIPDLIGASEVEALNANLSRLVREADDRGRHPAPGVSVQFEKGAIAAGCSDAERELAVRKFFQFGPADPFFWASVRDARIRAILDDLLGPGARLLQSMALVKPPGIGSPKDWHQDIPYFPITPAEGCLGVWIATDDATLENGCLQVVPGSHRLGPVPHVDGPTGWRLPDERVAAFAERVRPVPVRAGSAVVFAASLFHFSDHNRSSRRRRAVQYHYVAATVRGTGAAGTGPELSDLDSPVPPRLERALR